MNVRILKLMILTTTTITSISIVTTTVSTVETTTLSTIETTTVSAGETNNSDSSDSVSWMVVAERCDLHMYDTDWTDDDGHVIVEPEKEDEKLMPNLDEDNGA